MQELTDAALEEIALEGKKGAGSILLRTAELPPRLLQAQQAPAGCQAAGELAVAALDRPDGRHTPQDAPSSCCGSGWRICCRWVASPR